MTAPHRRLHDLFAEAIDLPPADRAAFLDDACGADVDLRAGVDALLSAHDRAGRFLSDPAVPAAAVPAAGPVRLGPYTLGPILGEGGHGTVYRAEQAEPLRRSVAVKVIRAGTDSGQTVRRFDRERRALAVMDHPNVARVFDAGTTPDGRPYFAMELVDGGRPITDYCRDRRLPTADRLGLFRDVCAAVQHAHQKGIVHRDLKPGNVLVADVDGRPVPKVIDFGVAKAIAPTATADPALTLAHQPLGTPQYMSPEQVRGGGADVDTRADVYALGAVLYELLADCPPFDPDTLRSAAAAELHRILTEVDPPRPSLRTPAAHVPRDLDWVVLKAIDKDRDRRYPTAEALAADLARFLADEPVEAGPPGWAYRAGKFVRRHRRLVATVAVVTATSVAAAVVATAGLVRARAERDRATAAEARAAAAQHAAERAAAGEYSARQFVYHLVAAPAGAVPPPPAVVEYLARRADDGLLADHPDVLATLHLALGMADQRADRPAAAVVQFRAFLAASPHVGGQIVDSVNVASTLNNLSVALIDTGDAAAAVPLLRQSLAMYRRLRGADDAMDAPVLATLGGALAATGDLAGAEPPLRSAAALLAAADPPGSPRVGQVLRTLAGVVAGRGDAAAARQLRDQADAVDRAAPPPAQPPSSNTRNSHARA